MPFPQFAVLIYATIAFGLEILTLVLVASKVMDVRGGKYRTHRDFTEATLFRMTTRATLMLLIYAGGFWS